MWQVFSINELSAMSYQLTTKTNAGILRYAQNDNKKTAQE
jgi:hypothetical protein